MLEERLSYIKEKDLKKFYLSELDKMLTLEQLENMYLRHKMRQLGIKKTFINYFKKIVNE